MSNSQRQGLKILLSALALLALGGGSVILYFESGLPNIRSIEDYRPQTGTKIYSDDGFLLAHLARERRTVIPIEQLPEHVKHAFLAAEDANFYQHEGLDYLGIFRAFLKNLRPGSHLQGASTITQQTVKTLILGPERSYSRKIREALLSRQLEQLLSKDEILHLYLNQIFFGIGNHGHAVYGVEEAAWAFFGKSVVDLGVGEAALLSCIPKNPSRYTLLSDPTATKTRQRYVLGQMRKQEWITESVAEKELKAPLPPPAPPPPYLGTAPHYVELIRRALREEFSEDQIYGDGLTVYSGANARMQRSAHLAVEEGLRTLTKRQGFLGAPLQIEVDQFKSASSLCHQKLERKLARRRSHPHPAYGQEKLIWDLRRLNKQIIAGKQYSKCRPLLRPLKPGQQVRAIVAKVNAAANEVIVDLGTTEGYLTFNSLKWARPFSPVEPSPAPHSLSNILRQGDLIDVRVNSLTPGATPEAPPRVTLELLPPPKLQGALVAISPHSRLVRAVVGGYGRSQTGFIRATQALRQPGSAFKPLVYATGIEETTITPASLCADSPVVIRDPWTGKAWKPENYEDGRYDGNITYRYALSKSKNTCSVKLVEKLTPETVINTARKMGITSKLPTNLTLALGTGGVTPLELTNAYSTLAAGGVTSPPIFIRKLVDHKGAVLKDTRPTPSRAISAASAFVVTHMMTSVVESGTAIRAKALGRPIAGKTGTTNRSRDAWFAGFSPELVATVWVGFDDNSPTGKLTGSGAALPIWIQFMEAALKTTPKSSFTPPPDVVFKRIDPDTGEALTGLGSVEEVFRSGTEPTESTAELPSLFIEDE